MAKISFKITAMTDVGLVRTNNEDNFVAITDLSVPGSTWKSDEICQLGELGALLVVADGMGGMNAGEVASEIAISTVKEIFSENITEKVLSSGKSIVAFMNDAIATADKRIKSEGKKRPETKGMGTTIVIAWLYKGLLYVSWCGDSRAYVYNAESGLVQITKDHSYVQELVDKGVIRPDEAFDFPESNVITRCLSHSSLKAEPDNIPEPYQVAAGDIILLCTDGLSGMIRDNAIASIIADNLNSMGNCASALIDAAKAAGGTDNITVDLCQILTVDNDSPRTKTAKLSDFQQPNQPEREAERHPTPTDGGAAVNMASNSMNNTVFTTKKKKPRKVLIIIYVVILAAAIGAGAYFGYKYFSGKSTADPIPQTEAASVADISSIVENESAVETASIDEPTEPLETPIQ